MYTYVPVSIFLASVAMAWQASRADGQLRPPAMWPTAVAVGVAAVAVTGWRLWDRELKGLPFEAWQAAVLMAIYACGFALLGRLKNA